MAIYSGTRNLTFAASTAAAHLYAAAGEFARVLEVVWSGEATTSMAQRTRLSRSSTAGTTPTTSLDIHQADRQGLGGAAAPLLDCVTTLTGGTLSAGSVIPGMSWNAHGGIVRWIAGPEEEIMLIHTAAVHLSIMNDIGTGAGSVGIKWKECS